MDWVISLFLGLILIAYILASADDVAFDLLYLFQWRKFRNSNISIEEIYADTPKRIAVMIPAWREAGVVADMIRSTLDLMNYPKSLVEFFVGVYPNDEATLEEVDQLAREHVNVHCVINHKNGPTNKSQNLNELYRTLEDTERHRGFQFSVVAIHDAEDVIHPYTFNLYNVLTNRYAAVQLPVFALFPKFKWRQWLGYLISGTYADEFAENHIHHVPVREYLRMFVPSAGTGFALRRDVLNQLASIGPIFNEGSLTEDYELSLRLWKMGHPVHFHIQRTPRLNSKGRLVTEIVAVKEYFPADFTAAIKQKGRWTYGIALQTPRLIGQRFTSLRDRFVLWRDRKGRLTNLVHLLGYPSAFYAFLGLFLPLPHAHPDVLKYLGLPVLLMTLERLFMRFLAIHSIYGLGQAMLGTLLLPGFPLRWLIGNCINTAATLRAWKLYFWPGGGAKKGSIPKWDKTERKSYASSSVLEAYRRRLGDTLLFHRDLTPKTLLRAIRNPSNERLGEWLVKEGILEKNMVRQRLAELQGIPVISARKLVVDRTLLPTNLREKWNLSPVALIGTSVVVATPIALEPKELRKAAQEVAASTGKDLIAIIRNHAPIVGVAENKRASLSMRFDTYLFAKAAIAPDVLAQVPEQINSHHEVGHYLIAAKYLSAEQVAVHVRGYMKEIVVPNWSDNPFLGLKKSMSA